MTGCRVDDRCSIPDGSGGLFLYPLCTACSGAQPASCTMGTGDLPGGKCGRGVLLTTHPLLVPWGRKDRSYNSSPPMLQIWHIMGNIYGFFTFTCAYAISYANRSKRKSYYHHFKILTFWSDSDKFQYN
jgi:hypothetical protein